MAHPDVQEFSTLLGLGFLPLRIASKLGEMERAGACRDKYVSFRINPPVLNFRAQNRAEANYGSMFGMPSYLANSDIAEVGYRGDLPACSTPVTPPEICVAYSITMKLQKLAGVERNCMLQGIPARK
jgi:hypothetical protein